MHAGRTFSCNQAYATETTYLSSRAESHRLGKPIPMNTFGDRTTQAFSSILLTEYQPIISSIHGFLYYLTRNKDKFYYSKAH